MKSLFYEKGIASIVLFHARANISMTGGTQPAEKQAGGYVAEHVPDIITKLTPHARVIEGSGDNETQIGVEVGIVCTKNKFATPFKFVKKKLIFGKGISKKIDLVDTAIENGVIVQSGAYFALPDGTKIRGRKDLYDLPPSTLKSIQETLRSLK